VKVTATIIYAKLVQTKFNMGTIALITIIVFWQLIDGLDGEPAHRSCYSVVYLFHNVPEFIEPENWPPNIWI